MHHCMVPSKTWWPSLNMMIFPPVMRFVLDDPKQGPPRRLLIKFRANLGRPPDFVKISNWATGHLTWEGWVHYSWRFGHAEALREVGPEMPERGTKTATVPVVWATFGIFFWRDPNDFLSGAIGDIGRNLVISLWPGDKVTIKGVAA